MSNLITPPVLRGTETQQLAQLRDYLFQLHRQLGTALTAVEEGNITTEAAQKISQRATGGDSVTREALSQQAAALKSLIIKTADIVRQEMDVITATLESDYVAKSDYGTYQESIQTQFTATAESVTQQINYAAEVAAAANAATGQELRDYIVETQGFIRQGIVGYNGVTPIIGIAIGQDIQTTGTGTVDGKTYDEIDTSSAMSTFTADKLSFYLNGAEVAYVSNARLFITDAEITNRLTLGNWEISHNRGFSIKWVGA